MYKKLLKFTAQQIKADLERHHQKVISAGEVYH
jgi:hypothetical protein